MIPGVLSSSIKGAVVPIATIKTTSVTDAFYFNNIPQEYQDLMVVWHTRGNFPSGTYIDTYLRFNNFGGSGAPYTATYMTLSGSSLTSARWAASDWEMISGGAPGTAATANLFGSVVIHVLDYKNTDKFKTALCESAADLGGSSGGSRISATLYKSKNAVSALNVFMSGSFPGNYFMVAGSEATLYGIRAER
jgi:hypothetical protein